MTRRWTLADLPDLSGRRIAVTGVTAGLGTQTAAELARAGAEVVLVARSADKLERTRAELAAAAPRANLVPIVADLADLTSVRAAASQILALGPLDTLINNAGVMALPYARTVDGFETQFATNHLAPFLLTGLLLPALQASGHGRVVAVASQAHRVAKKAPLADPRSTSERYSAWNVYAETKLANLLFTMALERRLRAAGLPIIATAAHPGYSATELMEKAGGLGGSFVAGVTKLLGQPAALGALPTLMAATADLPSGTYIGPDGPAEMRGYPQIVTARKLVYREDIQDRLWELSEAATGLSYP